MNNKLYYLICTLVAILLSISKLSNSAWAFETNASHAILIDYETDTVLFEKNADALMPPSSMSKMMTTYIVFDLLKKGTIKLNDKVLISKKAWGTGGSRTFVEHNSRVRISDLLQGMVIQSGNDASIALAEGIFGDESLFVDHMNNWAKKLKLKNTTFKNVTGLPHPEHLTTARDLATIGIHLIKDFPALYKYHSKKSFTFNKITQPNRNLLLGQLGVDGIKTGVTDAAGYGITVSAVRDGRRLIAVLNGLKNEQERKREAEKILNYGFNYFTNEKLASSKKTIINVGVWHGDKPKVALGSLKDIVVAVPKISTEEIQYKVRYNAPITAPVKKGEVVGKLLVLKDGTILKEYELITLEEVGKAGLFNRFIQNFKNILGINVAKEWHN